MFRWGLQNFGCFIYFIICILFTATGGNSDRIFSPGAGSHTAPHYSATNRSKFDGFWTPPEAPKGEGSWRKGLSPAPDTNSATPAERRTTAVSEGEASAEQWSYDKSSSAYYQARQEAASKEGHNYPEGCQGGAGDNCNKGKEGNSEPLILL